MQQYKVDFHTHSVASPDGALTESYYRRMLEQGRLHCIAVTDHNTIEMAERMQEELGDKIIVGEEITTAKGELVGLYLTKAIPSMLTLAETAKRIHEQGGLVYVPHPFETVRKGIRLGDLDEIAQDVDIIEIHNGRAVFQNRSAQALAWSRDHYVPGAASSDAHGIAGWGRTYTVLDRMPTRQNLTTLLRHAEYCTGLPGVRGVLYPKFNRIRKWRWHA
ncbi:MAG: PHP domain-containing protein [Patescibacteria group bacterium]